MTVDCEGMLSCLKSYLSRVFAGLSFIAKSNFMVLKRTFGNYEDFFGETLKSSCHSVFTGGVIEFNPM